MYFKYFLLALTISLVSCVPIKINQYVKEGKIQKRDGKWIENNPTEQANFVSKGKYRKGNKVGVWRTSVHDEKYQKDVYGKNLIKTKIFYPGGKIKVKGQSSTEITDDFIHWFYDGDWKYYDKQGKLIYIKKYHKGKPLDSIPY